MRKIVTISIILVSLLFGLSLARGNDCYETYIERNQVNLIDIAQLYAMLRSIANQECGTLGREEFERILEKKDLNIVSFSVLEARVDGQSGQEATTMIEEYVASHAAAFGAVSPNLVMTLIDIFYDRCHGMETCVAEHMSPFIGYRETGDGAGCMFAMGETCSSPPDDIANILNNATIGHLPDGSAFAAKRSEFLCDRYGDCAGAAGREKAHSK